MRLQEICESHKLTPTVSIPTPSRIVTDHGLFVHEKYATREQFFPCVEMPVRGPQRISPEVVPARVDYMFQIGEQIDDFAPRRASAEHRILKR